MSKVKEGTLKRNTYVHTASGLTVKFPKGTKVTAVDGTLTFNPVEGVKVVKCQGQYLACLWDTWHLIVFPDGGKTPYPLSML
jgi:hypothetical protein